MEIKIKKFYFITIYYFIEKFEKFIAKINN